MGMGGGGRGGGSRPRSPEGDAARATIRQKLDDNDTRAFLEAEPLFTLEQLPRAEELASKYREQLFERREAHDHRDE